MARLIFVLFVFLIVVMAIAVVARVFGLLDDKTGGSERKSGAAAPDSYPFSRKKYLLTKAERSFFGVLQLVVGGRYLICPMVRLADVIEVKRGTAKPQSHRNRIDRKHLDFVLCDPNTVSPVLAIELDDASHNKPRQQKADQLKNNALAAAGLPLLRVKAQQAYSTGEIEAQLVQCLREDSP